MSAEVSVWTFRNDNVDNKFVKATYSGPNFANEVEDFTICFRYQILFFSPGNRGINVWTAKNGQETIHLRLFNDKWANKFEIKSENGDRQVIWFDAEVPVRQWNSMCIVRDYKKGKFRVYQNNQLVFSYGECMTIGESSQLRESNVSCLAGGWKYKGQSVDFVGPCTKDFWQGYWCITDMTSPSSNNYNADTDKWGECSQSCLTDYDKMSPVLTHKLTPQLFNNWTIGAEIEDKVSFKGNLSDFFMWTYPLAKQSIDNFMDCQDIEPGALVSWTNWKNYWTLSTNGNSLTETTTEQSQDFLCRRENYRIYIGFPDQKNVKLAMQHCNAFGGRLPMSDE